MGQWSRAEIERAFAEYQQKAADAGRSGDWTAWADQFTEDAIYIEHHFGTFHGRKAIHEWISACMADYPGRDMPEIPHRVVHHRRGARVGGVPGLEPDEGSR